jgi:geranylgeranyl diphosphate synthase type II
MTTRSSASSEPAAAPVWPEHLVRLVEQAVAETPVVPGDPDLGGFREACRHPLEAGGKRLRPTLLLATVEALGGDIDAAVPAAVALEWIHTFSLVHDDLPAMDDDALRRGRPTTHVVYGEDVAILVGDLLLARAYRHVQEHAPPAVAGRVIAALGEGVERMILGQYLDVRPPEHPDEAWLRRMCALKTGALMHAAVAAGLAHTEARAAVADPYLAFADELGLGFQIVDDVLDAVGTDETLGKPAGSDAAHRKSTFVTVLGLEPTRELAAASERRCETLLGRLEGEPAALRAIAGRVYDRDR